MQVKIIKLYYYLIYNLVKIRYLLYLEPKRHVVTYIKEKRRKVKKNKHLILFDNEVTIYDM
jgi:hypothetical protein